MSSLGGSNGVRVSSEADQESDACQAVCELLRDHNWGANPRLMDRITNPGSRTPVNLIAWEGESIVGGLLGFTEAKWLRVGIMAVASSHRRQGIGTMLLRVAEETAVARGCCYAFADTMEHQSPGFYRNAGYVVSGLIDDWDSFGNAKYFFTRSLKTNVS